MSSQPPPLPLSIHHVAVVVSDLQRAESFYGAILGLSVLRRWDDARGRARSVWFELGNGAFLAVERAELTEPKRDDLAPGFHCVALSIRPDERQAWAERLEREGFHVFRQSPYTLYVRDPDGNIVGLSHFPDAATIAG